MKEEEWYEIFDNLYNTKYKNHRFCIKIRYLIEYVRKGCSANPKKWSLNNHYRIEYANALTTALTEGSADNTKSSPILSRGTDEVLHFYSNFRIS